LHIGSPGHRAEQSAAGFDRSRRVDEPTVEAEITIKARWKDALCIEQQPLRWWLRSNGGA